MKKVYQGETPLPTEQIVRLLQLTDTHLYANAEGRLEGCNTLASLQAVLAQARLWPAQAILLTGDLTQYPSADAYRLLKACLDDVAIPFFCIPGNHDDPAMMQAELVNENIRCCRNTIIGNWQLIFLNTYTEGMIGGCLNAREMEALEYCLQSDRDRHVLICLHHPPLTIASQWLDRISLANADEFFALLDRFPQVRAVIWGHIHQEYAAERNSVKLLGCPSTCVQFLPKSHEFALDTLPPGYRWLELGPQGEVRTGVVRLYETHGD
jgi:3',5'-cyclic-AMP phosphodiesterase